MKVDEFETKTGIKRWICKCGTSNSVNTKSCRSCRILINSENKTSKQTDWYDRMKRRKHAKSKTVNIQERTNIEFGSNEQTNN